MRGFEVIMELMDLESIIEGILFVSGEPVSLNRLSLVLDADEKDVMEACVKLRDMYVFNRRGIRLVFLDKSVQLCSSPEHAETIRLVLEARKAPSLSPQAMEVLAVVAYFQPVTKTYIEQIRGVDSSYTVNQLVDKGLVESCGRLSVPGRPMLYRTTTAFLRTFGIESLEVLPELPETEGEGLTKDGLTAEEAALRISEHQGQPAEEAALRISEHQSQPAEEQQI